MPFTVLQCVNKDIIKLNYVILINILLFGNWWSYESDRHTCHTKISMTQGLTANFCVNLLSINSTK